MRKSVLATTAAAFVMAAGVLATATVAGAQQTRPDVDETQEEAATVAPQRTSPPVTRRGMRRQEMMGQERGRGMRGAMMRGRGMRGGMTHPGMMRMMFILVDTDGDGALSLEEVQAVHARIFSYVDADGDGRVTLEEMRAFMAGMHAGDQGEAQQAQPAPGAAEDETASRIPTPTMRPGGMGQGMTGRQGMMRQQGMRGRGMRRGAGIHGDMMHPRMMRMMFILVDTDGDGALSLEEVQAVHARIFSYADADGDGRLTMEELRAFITGMYARDRPTAP